MSTLRICTWNTWHGLNPYQKLLMPPLESPWARVWRRRRQIAALMGMRQSEFDVFCLQEVSPLRNRLRQLERKMRMRGYGCVVNSGLKLGPLGIPPLLSEGLVTLAGKG